MHQYNSQLSWCYNPHQPWKCHNRNITSMWRKESFWQLMHIWISLYILKFYSFSCCLKSVMILRHNTHRTGLMSSTMVLNLCVYIKRKRLSGSGPFTSLIYYKHVVIASKVSWSYLRNMCYNISKFNSFQKLYCWYTAPWRPSGSSLFSHSTLYCPPWISTFLVCTPLSFSHPVMIAVIMGKKGEVCLAYYPLQWSISRIHLLNCTALHLFYSYRLLEGHEHFHFVLSLFSSVTPFLPAIPAHWPSQISCWVSYFWMVLEHELQVVQDLN